MKVTRQVESVALKTGKSISTIWRWAKAGCDLSSSASINQFLQGKKRKPHPKAIRKSKKENISAHLPHGNSCLIIGTR
jgi:hypothetical protein